MDDIRERDSDNAEVVADLATTLFDATEEIHQLPAQDRFLLETAALLHQRPPEEALAHPLSGQPEDTRELLAATLAHYRGLELPAAPAGAEARARALAALLRIAVALQALPLDLVIASPDRLQIHVEGTEAQLARVQEAAGPWSELYGSPVAIVAGPPRHDLSARLLGAPGLRPEMPFDQASRIVLDFYLGEVLEMRALSPEELVLLHRAVQGARRVFRTMSEQLDVTEVASIPKHLRWLSKTLRPVRQWHALVLNVESYLASTQGQLGGAEALLERWRVERARTTGEAQSALHSARYQEFAAATRVLMRSRNAGIFGKRTPRQPLYCIVPSMIWDYYQQLRALGFTPQPPPTSNLRAIRAQARDLYHLLAQYQSVLGPTGAVCMRAVQGLEESLTFYADLHRTISAADDFLQSGEKPVAGIRALIDAHEADCNIWLDRWPGLWKTVTAPRFRRSLGRAVAEL
jgi:hypothetical protein